MKNTLLLSVAATALLALAASPALAGTIGIGDFSGSETVLDFDDPGAVAGNAVPATSGATFNNLFYDDQLVFLFPTTPFVAANLTNPTDETTILSEFSIDFSSSMNRVGWDAVTNQGDNTRVTLFKGSDLVFDSGAIDTFSTAGFIGFEVLGVGFDRVVVNVETNVNGTHVMNDFRFEAIAVPLPPAAYMGLGLLAGIAILRRRRRELAAI